MEIHLLYLCILFFLIMIQTYSQFNFSIYQYAFDKSFLYYDYITSNKTYASASAGQQLKIVYFSNKTFNIYNQQLQYLQTLPFKNTHFDSIQVYQSNTRNFVINSYNSNKLCFYQMGQLQSIKCINTNYPVIKIYHINQYNIICGTLKEILIIQFLPNTTIINLTIIQSFNTQIKFININKNILTSLIQAYINLGINQTYFYSNVLSPQTKIKISTIFKDSQINYFTSILKSNNIDMVQTNNKNFIIFQQGIQSQIIQSSNFTNISIRQINNGIYMKQQERAMVSNNQLIIFIKKKLSVDNKTQYQIDSTINKISGKFQFKQDFSKNIYGYYPNTDKIYKFKLFSSSQQPTIQEAFLNTNSDELPEQIKTIITILSNVMSTPNLRVVFKFTIPILNIIDDYWAYVYLKINCTQINKAFLRSAKQIQDQPQIPSLFNSESIYSAVNISQILKYNHYQYTTSTYTNQQNHQFLFILSAQDTYMFNYAINGIFIIIFRLINICLNKIDQNKKDKLKQNQNEKSQTQNKTCLQQSIEYFYHKSSFQSALVALVQANIIFMSFNFGLQLKYHFMFGVQDKINLIITHFFGFIMLIYTFCFYPLIFAFKGKQAEHLFLGKVQQKYDLLNQNSLQVFRLIAYGSIQGYLIDNSILILSIMIGLKIFLIGCTIFSRKTFKNLFIFLLILLYYFDGLLIDISLLIQILDSSLIEIIQKYKIDWILIGSILIIALLKFLISFATDLKQQIFSNKISDESIKKKYLKRKATNQTIFNIRCQKINHNQSCLPFNNNSIIIQKINQNQLNNLNENNKNLLSVKNRKKPTDKIVSQKIIVQNLGVQSHLLKAEGSYTLGKKIKKPLSDQFLQHKKFLNSINLVNCIKEDESIEIYQFQD